MPIVDLSMVGIAGQNAAAERFLTMAQAENTQATAALNTQNARAQELQNEETERFNQIDQIAAERLNLLASGQAPTDDPYAAAFARGNAAQGGDDQQSAAIQMEVLADTFERNGAPSRAAAFRTEAMKIRKQEAEIANGAVLADQRRLENIQRGTEVVSSTIGVARNEAEWEYGKREIQAAMDRGVFVIEPELWGQIRQMPYDPEVAAYFRDKALTAKEEADLELKRITEARQAQQGALRLAQGEARLRISAAQAAETRRHNEVTEKNAGRSTQLATSLGDNDRDSIVASLLSGPLKNFKADGYTTRQLKDHPEVIAAANQIGEDTKRILAETPGITFETAKNRAIILAEQSGFLSSGDEGGLFGIGAEAPSVAKILPANATEDTLVDGEVYRTALGVGKWNASTKRFDPVN